MPTSPQITKCNNCDALKTAYNRVECTILDLMRNKFTNITYNTTQFFCQELLNRLIRYKRVINSRLFNPKYPCSLIETQDIITLVVTHAYADPECSLCPPCFPGGTTTTTSTSTTSTTTTSTSSSTTTTTTTAAPTTSTTSTTTTSTTTFPDYSACMGYSNVSDCTAACNAWYECSPTSSTTSTSTSTSTSTTSTSSSTTTTTTTSAPTTTTTSTSTTSTSTTSTSTTSTSSSTTTTTTTDPDATTTTTTTSTSTSSSTTTTTTTIPDFIHCMGYDVTDCDAACAAYIGCV